MKRSRFPLRFLAFVVMNGLLTTVTSVLIVFSLLYILDLENAGLRETIPVFLSVLAFTTVFFWIIYWQGRRLRAEKELLANVFEHIGEGVLILDSNFRVLQSNPAAAQMMELTADHNLLPFCSVCSNYPGVGKMCDYGLCFIEEQDGKPMVVKIRSGTGEISVLATASRFTDTEGRKLYILRIAELEDERKQEQERISRMITHSIMQAQENERKRLSRELHDGIGQMLYGSLIQLDIASEKLDRGEDFSDIIGTIRGHLEQTIVEVRHLSSELRPSVLDDLGLISALRNYIHEYSRKFGILINFSYEGDKQRLPAAMETAIYRIVQEALTNTAKYANADRADVFLIQQTDMVSVAIQDYGLGFEWKDGEERGVGLYSMEERASILGGTFTLQSAFGKGTTITVSFPVMREDEQDERQSSAGG